MDTQTATFGRGQTFYGKDRTIDTDDYGNSVLLEGMPTVFKNKYGPNHGDSTKIGLLVDHQDVYAICVRNTSGVTLPPCQSVIWQSGYRGRRINGNGGTLPATVITPVGGGEIAGIVDDHLGAATGVRDGDLFWLIVGGPVLWQTAGAINPAVVAGDIMQAATAAVTASNTVGGTITDTMAGMAERWAGTFVVTETTDGTAFSVQNNFAVAISAATTNETNTYKLVNLHRLTV